MKTGPASISHAPRGEVVLAFEGDPMTAREVRIARHTFVAGVEYVEERARVSVGNEPRSVAERRYPLPEPPRPLTLREAAERFVAAASCTDTPNVTQTSLTFRALRDLRDALARADS
jgi:hypothetical protein